MMNPDNVHGGLYGAAVGDALGVPYETESYESMMTNPCTGMTGYGHHRQPAGTWSDDTSMTLCTADSLCKGFDPDNMMKKFMLWKDRKQYTATGVVFDVGRTCRKAINQFNEGVPALLCGDASVNGNGNGSIMRILPMVLYQMFMCPVTDIELERFLAPVHEASVLTHAHPVAQICCGLFALTIREFFIKENSKKSHLEIVQCAFEKGRAFYESRGEMFQEEIRKPDLFIEPVKLLQLQGKELPNWGYVINTWNITLLSFLTTDSFRDCVLKAINMGGDTDTNGAVAGALSGSIYGMKSIPEEWINALQNKRLLDLIYGQFSDVLFGREPDRQIIDQLDEKYAFISMKAPSVIKMENYVYNDTMTAFLAHCVPEEYRFQFENTGAKGARKLYQSLPHLNLSDQEIQQIISQVTYARFIQHPDLMKKLKETDGKEIIYDTSGGHDNLLGRCRCNECKGKEIKNLYGKALMNVREMSIPATE